METIFLNYIFLLTIVQYDVIQKTHVFVNISP